MSSIILVPLAAFRWSISKSLSWDSGTDRLTQRLHQLNAPLIFGAHSIPFDLGCKGYDVPIWALSVSATSLPVTFATEVQDSKILIKMSSRPAVQLCLTWWPYSSSLQVKHTVTSIIGSAQLNHRDPGTTNLASSEKWFSSPAKERRGGWSKEWFGLDTQHLTLATRTTPSKSFSMVTLQSHLWHPPICAIQQLNEAKSFSFSIYDFASCIRYAATRLYTYACCFLSCDSSE